MDLLIGAVGRAKSGPERDLVTDYLARIPQLGRGIGIPAARLIEVEERKKLNGKERKRREGELLLSALPSGAAVIALDERGKNLKSTDFARTLGEWRDQGVGATGFVIGGADGLAKEVRDGARLTLSFGAATWPHMMVRAMLAEQLYRAVSILAAHPYHREG